MKCSNCGYESQEDFIYCTNCGTAVADAPAVSLNPVADKVLAVLKDRLFLVICILMSVSCVAALMCESIPIINILLTIFLWLTYSQAVKDCADPNHLRKVSGTVYANYIVANVIAIVFLVAGVLFAISLAVVGDDPEFWNIVRLELINAEIDLGELGLSGELYILKTLCLGTAFVLILAGALVLVFNILGMRKIHRFVKSVYQGILTQNPEFEKPLAARNWLIFFGVLSCFSVISSLSTPLLLIANGSLVAAEIIAIVMISKYFLSTEN